LPDLVDHLANLGAKAVQVRPVARAGRARTLDSAMFLSESDCARLYLVVLALQEELAGQVRMHCDLVPANDLWRQREAYGVLLGGCSEQPERWPLAELINPLVIAETGMLKPIAYDFNSRFDIGQMGALSNGLLPAYKKRHLPLFQSLIATAIAKLPEIHGLVDWFDYCTRQSEQDA
jgi:hypothetical protein